MFIRLNKRAQSTLEYAVVIAIVVAALIAMQVYIKRGLQGRWKQAADDVGQQFSPSYTNTSYTTNSSVNSTENVSGGSYDNSSGATLTMPVSNADTSQFQNRTGTENVSTFNNEYWPN